MTPSLATRGGAAQRLSSGSGKVMKVMLKRGFQNNKGGAEITKVLTHRGQGSLIVLLADFVYSGQACNKIRHPSLEGCNLDITVLLGA